jgi:SagB-type dehydrogenase family enzyme
MKNFFLSILYIIVCITMKAQDIKLPAPKKTGGMPVNEALNQRRTVREFAKTELNLQELSNLLWAANGVNRPDGKRTAPTARNMQQIEVLVILSKGIYLYDAKNNNLKHIVSGDYRNVAIQPFAQEAPVLLVFFANYDKMTGLDTSTRDLYAATDSGNVSQNIYLFCASEKWHTVALGSIDRDKIKELVKINGKAILGQAVGK